METSSTPSNKISKEEFLKILEEYKAQEEQLDKLAELWAYPVWDIPIVDYGNRMFDRVIKAYFTEEAIEWLYWWLYDKDVNPELKAFDEDGNEIPTETIEDLWELIKQYRK